MRLFITYILLFCSIAGWSQTQPAKDAPGTLTNLKTQTDLPTVDGQAGKYLNVETNGDLVWKTPSQVAYNLIDNIETVSTDTFELITGPAGAGIGGVSNTREYDFFWSQNLPSAWPTNMSPLNGTYQIEPPLMRDAFGLPVFWYVEGNCNFYINAPINTTPIASIAINSNPETNPSECQCDLHIDQNGKIQVVINSILPAAVSPTAHVYFKLKYIF